MQFLNVKPPVGAIYDSSLGEGIDGALAMALLYGLDGKDETRVVSISISKSNIQAAALAESIGRFYTGAVNGGFGSVSRSLPVGLSSAGKLPVSTPMLSVPLDKKNADGTPIYQHGIHQLNDTAEPAALLRNALTSQQDQNCFVVLAGPATNIVAILDLPGVKELIAHKVRYLSVSAGSFTAVTPDANVTTDVAAAKRLFAEWPTQIYATGVEIAGGVLFPAASIEKDFAWSPAHPVVDAYRAYRPMPYDAPTRDMATVLHAVRPKEGYFKLSAPGTISVLEDGRTKFSATTGGKHQYLIFDPEQRERLLKTYTEIASAKPVPRLPRFRRPNAVDPAKPDPAKAEPAKPADPALQ